MLIKCITLIRILPEIHVHPPFKVQVRSLQSLSCGVNALKFLDPNLGPKRYFTLFNELERETVK